MKQAFQVDMQKMEIENDRGIPTANTQLQKENIVMTGEAVHNIAKKEPDLAAGLDSCRLASCHTTVTWFSCT